jgi:hypothetical protein
MNFYLILSDSNENNFKIFLMEIFIFYSGFFNFVNF